MGCFGSKQVDLPRRTQWYVDNVSDSSFKTAKSTQTISLNSSSSNINDRRELEFSGSPASSTVSIPVVLEVSGGGTEGPLTVTMVKNSNHPLIALARMQPPALPPPRAVYTNGNSNGVGNTGSCKDSSA